jgi:hypothetical protein
MLQAIVANFDFLGKKNIKKIKLENFFYEWQWICDIISLFKIFFTKFQKIETKIITSLVYKHACLFGVIYVHKLGREGIVHFKEGSCPS